MRAVKRFTRKIRMKKKVEWNWPGLRRPVESSGSGYGLSMPLSISMANDVEFFERRCSESTDFSPLFEDFTDGGNIKDEDRTGKARRRDRGKNTDAESLLRGYSRGVRCFNAFDSVRQNVKRIKRFSVPPWLFILFSFSNSRPLGASAFRPIPRRARATAPRRSHRDSLVSRKVFVWRPIASLVPLASTPPGNNKTSSVGSNRRFDAARRVHGRRRCCGGVPGSERMLACKYGKTGGKRLGRAEDDEQ